jgi:hypothetical protein
MHMVWDSGDIIASLYARIFAPVRCAQDVGQNTEEIWCLRGGGGWFHPIHSEYRSTTGDAALTSGPTCASAPEMPALLVSAEGRKHQDCYPEPLWLP